MAITLVAHTFAQQLNTGPAGATTPPIDTTGADLLIIPFTGLLGSIVNSTDSMGNTWHTAAQIGTTVTVLQYAWNPIVGPGHTASNGTTNCGMCFQAFKGVQTSSDPLDQTSKVSGSGATVTAASLTPGQANELVVFGAGDNWAGTVSTNLGVIDDQSPISPSGHTANATLSGHVVQTSAVPAAPQLTFSIAAVGCNIVMASFKAAAASSANHNELPMMGVG